MYQQPITPQKTPYDLYIIIFLIIAVIAFFWYINRNNNKNNKQTIDEPGPYDEFINKISDVLEYQVKIFVPDTNKAPTMFYLDDGDGKKAIDSYDDGYRYIKIPDYDKDKLYTFVPMPYSEGDTKGILAVLDKDNEQPELTGDQVYTFKIYKPAKPVSEYNDIISMTQN